MDLKEGFIRLNHEHTKTNEGRLVPLNKELVEMFQAMRRGWPGVSVFTYRGKSFDLVERDLRRLVERRALRTSPATICATPSLTAGG
jgi:hypothetical protein